MFEVGNMSQDLQNSSTVEKKDCEINDFIALIYRLINEEVVFHMMKKRNCLIVGDYHSLENSQSTPLESPIGQLISTLLEKFDIKINEIHSIYPDSENRLSITQTDKTQRYSQCFVNRNEFFGVACKMVYEL